MTAGPAGCNRRQIRVRVALRAVEVKASQARNCSRLLPTRSSAVVWEGMDLLHHKAPPHGQVSAPEGAGAAWRNSLIRAPATPGPPMSTADAAIRIVVPVSGSANPAAALASG